MFSENDRRGCIFQNICYRRSDKKFVYYNPNKRPVFYDKKMGPLFSFGERFISLAPIYFFRDYFAPLVEFKRYPFSKNLSNAIELDKLHVYWTRNSFILSNR